ncbi:hypothetical protein [Bradyrhizobium japonicum]|uniref:hypothetical protein n=1 Tax=Bradyrhizobium japonicum TaxID=375 RepID=UPI001872E46B|nr:hypothetical protein [Bradyrhizobium japonicum]
MNMQCGRLRLAVRSVPPAPRIETVKTSASEPPKAANDNHLAWPFLPFPLGWDATN